MLFYPKMPGSRNCPGGRCIAFEKYDGTNLHWAWDRDFGWHSFGTRRDEFNLSARGVEQFARAHEGLGECVELFHSTLAAPLENEFRQHSRYRSVGGFRVFTEFLGRNSFAGMHRAEDPKELVLFDVLAEGFGILGPSQFVTDFGRMRTARVVYEGKFTGTFAEEVRQGKFGVAEGVVSKGGAGGSDVWMVKIKTYAYLEKLKRAFAEGWEDYWE